MSNRTGGKYRVHDIGRREWERFGAENDLDWDTASACRELAERVRDALPEAAAAQQDAGDRRVIDELKMRLTERADAVSFWLRH